METKLRQLMKHEGITSSRMAEILGTQASGISHIMSGRNKPSYDFLLRLLLRFPQINPDWLLLDRGPMYRDEIKNKKRPEPVKTPIVEENSFAPDNNSIIPASPPSGRDFAQREGGAVVQPPVLTPAPDPSMAVATVPAPASPNPRDIAPSLQMSTRTIPERHGALQMSSTPPLTRTSSIERIVVFYKDKTFSEYQPEG